MGDQLDNIEYKIQKICEQLYKIRYDIIKIQNPISKFNQYSQWKILESKWCRLNHVFGCYMDKRVGIDIRIEVPYYFSEYCIWQSVTSPINFKNNVLGLIEEDLGDLEKRLGEI